MEGRVVIKWGEESLFLVANVRSALVLKTVIGGA